MSKQQQPNLRGKGVSETKFTKDGSPKRAGNWSESTIHRLSLQFKDYPVRCSAFGFSLIVGDHTPLENLMGDKAKDLALYDPYFDTYVQTGVKTVGVKQYECHKRLTRCRTNGFSIFRNDFIYREEIYTDGDFKYYFPEY